MSKIGKAIYEIENLSDTAQKDIWLNNLNPTVKLFVTLLYISLTVSFPKYDILGVLSMALYPLVIFTLGDISFRTALHRLRFVLPIVAVMGIFNPIFDRETVATIHGVSINSGWFSFLTLMIKGILTVFATYFLIATTTIEKICYSLKKLHLPQIIVTQILLMYRYIFVLLAEVKKITLAYELRAPGQKGVHFKAWGSLVGNLLIHTFERAQSLYDSMCLRGYTSEFRIQGNVKIRAADIIFLLGTSALFVVFRIFPVFELVGKLLASVAGKFGGF